MLKNTFNILLQLLLLLSPCLANTEDEPSPVVQVEQGQVQGTIKYTPEGRQFYAYQGIPFGKAPTGPLRFKAPEPAEPWGGVFQAISDPPPCMQISFNIFKPANGVEDCLQLNVYTPQLPSNTTTQLLATHVFIHGGGYFTGRINYKTVNPERYMNTDMVVVAMKYRLGPLGFLATDDEAASGNWGLLDQNLALKWVQQNIAAFCGNPNDVTLTGQSAGSASVIYQYLSPMSAGLFNRAIAESGTPLSAWSLQEQPAYYAKAMGENFNCSTENTTQLMECLREQNAEDVVKHSLNMMVKYLTLVFVPSVETSSSGQFLTEDPLTSLETGNFNKVPLQLGFNRDEGCIVYEFTSRMFHNFSDTTFDVVIPTFLYALTDYETNLINVSYAIKYQYYTDVDKSNQTEVNIATIKWISDVIMKSGISQTAALISSHNVPTYLYAFNYVSNRTLTHFTGEPDISHGSELKYLWYVQIRNADDNEFGGRFFELWTSFIFNGKPTASLRSDDPWQPTPPGQYNYYDINQQFTMRGNYDTDDMNFWWNEVPAIVNGEI